MNHKKRSGITWTRSPTALLPLGRSQPRSRPVPALPSIFLLISLPPCQFSYTFAAGLWLHAPRPGCTPLGAEASHHRGPSTPRGGQPTACYLPHHRAGAAAPFCCVLALLHSAIPSAFFFFFLLLLLFTIPSAFSLLCFVIPSPFYFYTFPILSPFLLFYPMLPRGGRFQPKVRARLGRGWRAGLTSPPVSSGDSKPSWAGLRGWAGVRRMRRKGDKLQIWWNRKQRRMREW